MGYEAPYPIRFSKEEMRKPLEDGDKWNEIQTF